MSATIKPNENKREEFRKYLERTGVMDALTKVLVTLYEEPEKPQNALEYIHTKIQNSLNKEDIVDGEDNNSEELKKQLEESQVRVKELEAEIEKLKNQAVNPASEGLPGED